MVGFDYGREGGAAALIRGITGSKKAETQLREWSARGKGEASYVLSWVVVYPEREGEEVSAVEELGSITKLAKESRGSAIETARKVGISIHHILGVLAKEKVTDAAILRALAEEVIKKGVSTAAKLEFSDADVSKVLVREAIKRGVSTTDILRVLAKEVKKKGDIRGGFRY